MTQNALIARARASQSSERLKLATLGSVLLAHLGWVIG